MAFRDSYFSKICTIETGKPILKYQWGIDIKKQADFYFADTELDLIMVSFRGKKSDNGAPNVHYFKRNVTKSLTIQTQENFVFHDYWMTYIREKREI